MVIAGFILSLSCYVLEKIEEPKLDLDFWFLFRKAKIWKPAKYLENMSPV